MQVLKFAVKFNKKPLITHREWNTCWNQALLLSALALKPPSSSLNKPSSSSSSSSRRTSFPPSLPSLPPPGSPELSWASPHHELSLSDCRMCSPALECVMPRTRSDSVSRTLWSSLHGRERELEWEYQRRGICWLLAYPLERNSRGIISLLPIHVTIHHCLHGSQGEGYRVPQEGSDEWLQRLNGRRMRSLCHAILRFYGERPGSRSDSHVRIRLYQ